MYASRNFFPTLTLLALLLGAAGCADGGSPTEPLVSDAASHALTAPELVPCPTAGSEPVSGLLRVLGGILRLDGHTLDLPFLAILRPVRFEMSVPASDHLEVTIHANGRDSFTFRRPARITIDYSHCPIDRTNETPLRVWQIDPATGAPIEFMGGVDDPARQRITFETNHLSTFSLAR